MSRLVYSEVLFKEGAWKLYSNPGDLWWGNFSQITHKCSWWKTEKKVDSYTMFDGVTECPHCGETIPDSLQTLWTLHNFDEISNRPKLFDDNSFYLHGTSQRPSPGNTYYSTGHSNFYLSV